MLNIHKLLFVFFMNINAYSFISLIYVFLLLLALLLVLTGGFTNYKKKIAFNKNLWKQTIAEVISEAIFFTDDEEEEQLGTTNNIEKLLKKSRFRNCLINEMIAAKKNISGSSRQSLKNVYEKLHLDKDSVKKLNSRKDHIKAKGIHELAMMEQVKYEEFFFGLTDNANELVRNEAQCALVGFNGFSGLRFLDATAYPISQWQQIQLLNKLNKMATTSFEPLKNWLHSSNESVVIFSLKLAAYYNSSDFYNEIINCLHSPAVQVKLQVIEYLKKIPGENGADEIIRHYCNANKRYKLAVLDALLEIGSEKQLSFLLKQLRNEDDDIKAAAAKCVSHLHPSGKSFLQIHRFADENPWKAIFQQIKTDHAA